MFIVVAIIFAISFFIFFVSLENIKYYKDKTHVQLRLKLRKHRKHAVISGFTMVASIGAVIAMYNGLIGGWF